MMVYFPEIYDDELAYSVFARYHLHTGHLTFRATAEDLFQNKNIIPSPEFLVELTEETVQLITRKISFPTFIEKHTMLPYYIRFLPKERRCRALDLLTRMDKSFYDALYMQRSKTERRKYMRYCPLCAAADREQHGETYWHRKHQLPGIEICMEHSCRLEDSTVGIDSDSHRFTLAAADTAVPMDTAANMEVTDQEKQIAGYVLQVFDAPIDLQTDTAAGKFLHTKLEGTRYTSPRGENVYARKLYADMTEHYGELPQYSFKAWWYVQKVFCSQSFHTFDICQIAAFLQIPVPELLTMPMPEQPLHQRFDARVMELHRQGNTYKQIAKMLGVSLDAIKAVGEKRYMSTQKISCSG